MTRQKSVACLAQQESKKSRQKMVGLSQCVQIKGTNLDEVTLELLEKDIDYFFLGNEGEVPIAATV